MPESDSKTHSTTRGVYRLFLGNFTSTILLAVTAVIVGRLLGPAGYGLYSIALITPGYLQTITQLGLSNAATRYPAKLRSEGEGTKAVSFLYSIVAFEGLFAALVVAATLPFSGLISSVLFGSPDMAFVVTLADLSLVGQGLFTLVSAGFQGMDQMGKSAGLQILQSGSKLVVTLAMILAGFALVGAIAGFSISLAVAGVVGFVQLIRLNGRLIPKGWTKDIAEGLRYSLPLYVSAIAVGLVPPYQLTLLVAFTSAAQIGWFGAAVNMTTLVVLLSYPIYTALFPLFSKLTRDKEALADTYRRSVRYSTVFVVPAVAFMTSFGSVLSAALFGRAYALAGPYLALSVMQYLAVGVGEFAFVAVLNALGQTREAAAITLANSFTILAASTFLVPPLGVYGAIAASLVGMAVSTVVGRWFVIRKLGAKVDLSSVWRIYLSSALAGLAVYPLTLVPLHPIVLTIIGAALYLLLVVPFLALTKAISEQDVKSLEVLFSDLGLASRLFRIAVLYYRTFTRSPA